MSVSGAHKDSRTEGVREERVLGVSTGAGTSSSSSSSSSGVTEDSVMEESKEVEGTDSGGPRGEGAGREVGTSKRLSLGTDCVTEGPRSRSESVRGVPMAEGL